jgi:glucose-6-phosphate isomerase
MKPAEFRLGKNEGRVDGAFSELAKEDAISRVWSKDSSLWKDDPKHRKIIENALGWLTVARTLTPEASELAAFAREIRDAGFSDVVLLGMGGSSLAPLVFEATFGSKKGFPRLQVLDSTDPAEILHIEQSINLKRTLFLVSSKSGSTLEPNILFDYFFAKAPADHFVVITDPGSALEKEGRKRGVRKVFSGSPDIGGRYSALSRFGVVPLALMGVDVGRVLASAEWMAGVCRNDDRGKDNPGLALGAMLGGLARHGIDKLTLLASPELERFGMWIEQLIAESTGKEGKGILPVDGEPVGDPSVYGADRLFAYLRLEGTSGGSLDASVDALSAAGFPVAILPLENRFDVGAEMFRWEFATAIAGVLLEIDAFDQPNVQESKDNTNRILEEEGGGAGLVEEVLAEKQGVRLLADAATRRELPRATSFDELLAAHLARVQRGDYLALTAYIESSVSHETRLNRTRQRLRDSLRVATTLGFGPRFLHSTGQLHKGGAGNGVFIQLTAEPESALPIPGRPWGFEKVIAAQAQGDMESLRKRNRRAIRVHLPRDVAGGLEVFDASVAAALAARKG